MATEDSRALDADTADRFEQDLHRRVGQLMASANAAPDQVARLLNLAEVCETQARDLRRAAARRRSRRLVPVDPMSTRS